MPLVLRSFWGGKVEPQNHEERALNLSSVKIVIE